VTVRLESTLVDQFPEGVLLVDTADASVREANQTFCDLVGREADALAGERLGRLLSAGESPGPNPSTVERAVRRAVDEQSRRVDGQVETADGQLVPVAVTLTGIGEDDAEVLAVVRPVSDREAHTRELERYRRRLDGAMFVGGLAWWELDVPSGEVTFHERKADMLGFSPGRFSHYEDFTDLLHPDDYERAMDAMRDHYSGETDQYDAVYRIQTAAGGYRWFRDVGAITEWTADGDPATVTGVVVDVTDQKAAETDLRESNARLALLNQLVRHDIRNDLNVSLGWLEVAEDALADGNDVEEARDALERVRASHEDAVELTHAVGDLMQVLVDDTDARGRLEPTALQPVLAAELDRVRESYYAATVTVDGDVPEVDVRANALLSSVFSNLLGNAVRHGRGDEDEPPTVTVTVSENREAGTVTVTVADDGPGVPEELQSAIFERGVTTTDGMDDAPEGTGLGLYIVQTLVEAYGGSLDVADAEGGGAAFCVELLLAD
jgi:PAS domain S-box-containing protein